MQFDDFSAPDILEDCRPQFNYENRFFSHFSVNKMTEEKGATTNYNLIVGCIDNGVEKGRLPD